MTSFFSTLKRSFLFFSVGVFGATFIVSAFPINASAAKYDAQSSVQRQARLYNLYSVVTNPNGEGSCVLRGNMDNKDITDGNWLRGTARVGLIVDNENGEYGCNNENNWFSDLLNEAGYSGKYTELGSEIWDANGNLKSGATDTLRTRLKEKLGMPDTMPNAARYAALMKAFTAQNGCQAVPETGLTADQKSSYEQNRNINFYNSATNTSVKQRYYFNRGGDQIGVGKGLTNDGRYECTTIANLLQSDSNNLAQAVVASQVVNTPQPEDCNSAANSNTPATYQACLARNASLANTAPQNPPEFDDGTGGAADATEEDMCNFDGNPMTWFICPILDSAIAAIGVVDGFITDSLTFGTTGVFENDSGFYAAWNSFRIIATALLLLAGLVIVVSQALGFEFLDAYTLRKSLPRLLVAIIGISLSWYLMKYAIQFINVFGHDVRDIMYGPFRGLNQGFSGADPGGTPLGGGALFLTNGVFFGALLFLGPLGMLSFVGTALLAILVGFLIILVRNIAITLLIILAPIAIVCYILPNTEKVWKLWYTNFVGLLLVFPIIMGLIAAGHIFSLVALTGSNANEATGAGSVTEVIGIVAYFIPYFILPLAFRFATGLIGNIAGFVNDKNRGAFDRLKKFRGDQKDANMGALKQGFNRTKIGSSIQGGRERSIAKRAAWGSGAIGMGKNFGGARYRSEMSNAEFGHMAGGAAEAIKNNPSAAANDDANKIARIATSKKDFTDKYYESKKKAGMTTAEQNALRAEAVNQLAFTEQAYGTNMGSTQMKHTAATAALSSNSSTDSVGERAQWMRQAVRGHVMTNSQAASLIKQSGSLASSAGFGDLLGAAAVNPDDATAVTASNEALLTAATKGFNPANSHRMRKGQAQEMAMEVHRQAQFAANKFGTGSDEFAKAIADAAGIHDVMNGMTPDVREEYATYLNGASVAGKKIRDHETYLESVQQSGYMDRRKTWGATAAAAGATGATGAGGGAPGGGAGGGGGTGGGS